MKLQFRRINLAMEKYNKILKNILKPIILLKLHKKEKNFKEKVMNLMLK